MKQKKSRECTCRNFKDAARCQGEDMIEYECKANNEWVIRPADENPCAGRDSCHPFPSVQR